MNMNVMGMNFNNMFGNVDPDMCRLSFDGNIAINVNGEYKVYDAEKGFYTNCNQFVVDMGNMFFVLPTNKVAVGDIILAGGNKRTPKYVLEKTKTTLRVFDYLEGEVKEIIPERQMFMGKQYCYGKIVSLFGGNKGIKGKGFKGMMKFMMLANLMNGKPGNGSGDMMQTMMMMSMMNGKDNLFDDMLDFEFDEDEDNSTETATVDLEKD